MHDHSHPDDTPLVTKDFFERSAEETAPDLVGCYFFTTVGDQRCGGMIIETEAYDENDPFSHCYRDSEHDPTPSSKPMFGEPGNIYIYRTGNGEPCLNFVSHTKDICGAGLIRALFPTCNQEEMLKRRIAYSGAKVLNDEKRRYRNLCNGPGITGIALGINDWHFQASKSGLSLLEPPFEIRHRVEEPKLVSGIRVMPKSCDGVQLASSVI